MVDVYDGVIKTVWPITFLCGGETFIRMSLFIFRFTSIMTDVMLELKIN